MLWSWPMAPGNRDAPEVARLRRSESWARAAQRLLHPLGEPPQLIHGQARARARLRPTRAASPPDIRKAIWRRSRRSTATSPNRSTRGSKRVSRIPASLLVPGHRGQGCAGCVLSLQPSRRAGRTRAAGRRSGVMQLKHDQIRLDRKGNGGGLPLPLWERVGARGYGRRLIVTPHPDRISRCGPTSPRGEVK